MTDIAPETLDWLQTYLRKPVAVFGAGVSGVSACDFLRSLGAEVDIFDEKKAEEPFRSFDAEKAASYALVVYSPGFPFEHPWFSTAKEAGLELMPEGDLGAVCWRGPIVAITGTNGKTTLTEFLDKAFCSFGMESYRAGNIGRPLTRLLADGVNSEAIAVMEVSSFQAANSSRLHADYLLWTNFDEDHLDRHESLEDYFASKAKLIELLRGDIFLYGESVAEYGEKFGYSLDANGLVTTDDDPVALGVKGTVFDSLPELNSYLMARALWLRMGLPEEELIEAAHSFKKSPHRMELVHNDSGISYWDDSKATNFHAVYGALSRFSEPVVWIGGGKCKGGDIRKFAQSIAPKVRSAHLIGETKQDLEGILAEENVCVRVYESLEEATRGARASSQAGDNILLSPGFASLDMFEGYSQRGEIFKKAINNLEDI